MEGSVTHRAAFQIRQFQVGSLGTLPGLPEGACRGTVSWASWWEQADSERVGQGFWVIIQATGHSSTVWKVMHLKGFWGGRVLSHPSLQHCCLQESPSGYEGKARSPLR